MSFLRQISNCKQYFIKTFQAYSPNFRARIFPGCVPDKSFVLDQTNDGKTAVRKMSLPLFPAPQASMTLEAAVVLPLFLFFALNLLTAIEMLRLHGNLTWALNEAGGKLAVYGHAYGQVFPDDGGLADTVGDAAFSYLYIREKIKDSLGEEYLRASPLGGSAGILFSRADIMEDDRIDLVITYRMKLPFGIGEPGEIRAYNCYYARAWTGYDVAGSMETAGNAGNCVYVTETGSVYHSRRDCGHLTRRIRSAPREEAALLRNGSGQRYTACERCGEGEEEIIFVTEDGNRYHSDRACGGLKRTVYEMTVEAAAERGYPPCSQCGE